MRERLTAAFVVLTLTLLLIAGAVRGFAVDTDVRERESARITDEVAVASRVLDAEVADGAEVDEILLRPFLVADAQMVYAVPGEDPIVLTGAEADPAAGNAVTATVPVADGELTITRGLDSVVPTFGTGSGPAGFAIFLLAGIAAGVVGYGISRAMAQPFRRLAGAASALGRGRFDLDLPRSRIPEAQAIATALEVSAAQLRERLEREQAFALHASHVLRTPLTSLRIRLEELESDRDATEEQRDAAAACLHDAQRIDEVTGELLEISSRGALLAGAQVPLYELATQAAQRWADVLDEVDLTITGAVEGDIALPVTPGPVEQVLDALLDEVARPGGHDVRLVFVGEETRLRLDLTGAPCPARLVAEPGTTRVGLQVAALGGRVETRPDDRAVRVHLPRR